jgi:hypothetical protein
MQGSLKVYKFPLPADVDDPIFNGFDPSKGLFQKIPSNDPVSVLVRVYIVKVSEFCSELRSFRNQIRCRNMSSLLIDDCR